MNATLYGTKIDMVTDLYLKDPESSALGKRIVSQSIELIQELGFERFTFKKLGHAIQSNESSIYRYFENKHKLLIYLTTWYWSWMENQMLIACEEVDDPRQKLMTAIEVITAATVQDFNYMHVNEIMLKDIVIAENSKVFLTKMVDKENSAGYFKVYKRLSHRISEMIISVDPAYPYPSSLASTVLEGALHQHFLMGHLQNMTDCNSTITPTDYFKDLINRLLH